MRGANRFAGALLVLAALACGDAGESPRGLTADDIPIAYTPPGGYREVFPEPVLAGCTEPLVAGAPDLRGLWRTLHAERMGEPVAADDRVYSYVERIETTNRSARLPASSDPISFSRPRTRAPSIVAIRSAVRAGRALGSLLVSLCRNAA